MGRQQDLRRDGNAFSADASAPTHFAGLECNALKLLNSLDLHHDNPATSSAVFLRGASSAGLKVTFVFGSVARVEAIAEGDVDLMVIGDLGLRKLSQLLTGVSERIGREVNPHVMSESEYRKRIRARDHFVTHVLDGPRIFVIADRDDLDV